MLLSSYKLASRTWYSNTIMHMVPFEVLFQERFPRRYTTQTFFIEYNQRKITFWPRESMHIKVCIIPLFLRLSSMVIMAYWILGFSSLNRLLLFSTSATAVAWKLDFAGSRNPETALHSRDAQETHESVDRVQYLAPQDQNVFLPEHFWRFGKSFNQASRRTQSYASLPSLQ